MMARGSYSVTLTLPDGRSVTTGRLPATPQARAVVTGTTTGDYTAELPTFRLAASSVGELPAVITTYTGSPDATTFAVGPSQMRLFARTSDRTYEAG